MAKWEIEKSLKAIREAIAEFYADYDQTYKMSCFGQEEIRGLKRQEVELLRLLLAMCGWIGGYVYNDDPR